MPYEYSGLYCHCCSNRERALCDKVISEVLTVGNEEKYDALLKENELLFMVDLIKEKLSYAYTLTDEAKMTNTSF